MCNYYRLGRYYKFWDTTDYGVTIIINYKLGDLHIFPSYAPVSHMLLFQSSCPNFSQIKIDIKKVYDVRYECIFVYKDPIFKEDNCVVAVKHLFVLHCSVDNVFWSFVI